MARHLAIDGNGTTLKSGSTLIGGITEFTTIPGWSRPEIEDTEIGNTTVNTFVLGTLKNYNALAFNLKFANSAEVPETNSEYTLTFTDGSTITFWGQLMQLGDASANNGASVTRSCQIKLTNLNASGVETAPVATYGGGSSSSSASA